MKYFSVGSKNPKGQTLVAIVALMLFALVIGVSASSRFISRMKSFTVTDDAAKAQAFAEALLERLLTVSSTTLGGYITNGNCGTNCSLSVTDTNGRIISASASLGYTGDSGSAFEADLTTTDPFQVNLLTYPTGKTIDVCWNTAASVFVSYLYDNSGTIGVDIYAYNAINSQFVDNKFSKAAVAHGFTNCFSFTTRYTPQMLRLRGMYLNTAVFIFPAAGLVVPKQGILITSTGKAGKTSKTVQALKTSAVAPSLFDFVIFQRSSSSPLSNISP